MSQREEENKAVVRKAIDAFNRRDYGTYFACHTEDSTSWEVFFDKPLTWQQSRGFIPDYWGAYPDARVDTQVMIAEGDVVAVENIISGTFRNDFMGRKATGKSFRQAEAVFFRLENGRIKETRIFTDQKFMEQQLGVS